MHELNSLVIYGATTLQVALRILFEIESYPQDFLISSFRISFDISEHVVGDRQSLFFTSVVI